MAQERKRASQAAQEAGTGDPRLSVEVEAGSTAPGPENAVERLSPMDSFREAAIELRRPFTPEAIKWKVQSNFGEKGCLVVGYIDARLVIERLNLLLPHLWHDQYTPLDQNWLRCDLTVDGITRSDVGFGAGKTGYSDALKRAGVKFGVGVSLYAIPRAELWRDNHGSYLSFRKYKKRGKDEEVIEFKLTAAGDEALRERYSKWLEEVGVPLFGQPINHGDVVGSVGDADLSPAPDVEADEGGEGPVAQLLEGDDAEALREEARDIYQGIVEIVGRSAYPPGEFQSGLAAHGHSLEALEEFIAALGIRLGQAQESRAAAA